MSAQKHRQPIVNWSSVVLLSTLLLSPMTAGAFLHALAQAFPQAFAAVTAANTHATAATPADANDPAPTRRANDEQEALRQAATRTARLRTARLDTDPQARLQDWADARAARAVLIPITSTERITEPTAVVRAAWPDTADARLRSRLVSPVPPRAPPVS